MIYGHDSNTSDELWAIQSAGCLMQCFDGLGVEPDLPGRLGHPCAPQELVGPRVSVHLLRILQFLCQGKGRGTGFVCKFPHAGRELGG